jgi:TonB family protein
VDHSSDLVPQHLSARRLGATVALAVVLLLGGCTSADRPLQLVSGAGAVYPPQARAEGIEGYAVVRYDVETDGRVVNARVVASSPQGVFDDSAVQAVSRWRFRPAERNGEPTAVSGLESRLDFLLKGGEAYADY